MSLTSQPAGWPELLTGRRSLALVIMIYVVLYSVLLLSTGGLPYVFDNNESFSSLWHAMNLDAYGIGQSKGLADEAASPNAAAHPYVHSHQGNMPRLFAWAIYELGARTVESQIVVTTMTVGLATMALIHLFFARLATPAFGLTVAMVFMTDYILFAQWHVVTYRVWYAALLFSGLCSIERAFSTGGRRWEASVLVVSILLFYFELVFAAFVSAFCSLYLIALSWRNPRTVIRIVAIQVLGAVTGLSVLIAQGVAYLGFEDFVRDIRITFLARNDAGSASLLLQEAVRFYESKNVIFWQNIQDRTSFSGLGPLIRSFTGADWKVHTPFLFWVVVVLLTGYLLSMLPRQSLERPLGALFARSGYSRIAIALAAYSVLFAGLFVLILNFSNVVFVVGSSDPRGISGVVATGAAALVMCFATAIVTASTVPPPLQAGTSCNLEMAEAVQAVSLFFTGLVVVVGAAVLAFSDSLFDQAFNILWLELYRGVGLHFAYPVVMITVIAGGALIAISRQRQDCADRIVPLQGVFIYLACGLVAFAIVHFLSPGYVHSGYLIRHAPLTVFITDVVIAIAIYAALSATCQRLISVCTPGTPVPSVPAIGLAAYLSATATLACGAVSVLLVAFWFSMQATYMRLLPPDHFAFLKQLAHSPFAGSSTVVNNYAAPVATYTGQWSYFDSLISQAYMVTVSGGTRIAADDRYLWFADRGINPDYRRPDYFICMIPQSMDRLLSRLAFQRKRGPPPPGCTELLLVQLARARSPQLPGFELVSHDEAGIARSGYSSWAIVRLNWTDAVEVDYDMNSFRRGAVR